MTEEKLFLKLEVTEERQKAIVREVRDLFNRLPDGPNKTDMMIEQAYVSGYAVGMNDPHEALVDRIRQKAVKEFMELISAKCGKLSAEGLGEIEAVMVAYFDIDLKELYDEEDIPALPAEYLGLIQKHKMWREIEKKEEGDASD